MRVVGLGRGSRGVDIDFCGVGDLHEGGGGVWVGDLGITGRDLKMPDTGLGGRGLRDLPLVCFELAGGCRELVAEVTLGLQEVPFANLLLFPIGEFGCAAVGECGLGSVPFQCRGPGLGVVGLELLSAGGDAFALLVGSGLAV